MKGFVTVIGLLTLAQWVFVGLLYGFINYQGKDSPETLAKLHDLPVVGGYFPKVTLITQEEKDREYGDELRTRRLEAQRFYQLPEAFNAEEFTQLTQSIARKGEDLSKRERELDQRKLEVDSMINEISKREANLLAAQDKLDNDAALALKQKAENELQSNRLGAKVDEVEMQSYRRIAKLLNGIEPKNAQERLMSAPDNETMKERNARFDEAAKILTFMDVEQAGQIISSMEPTDAAFLIERMKSLPTAKK